MKKNNTLRRMLLSLLVAVMVSFHLHAQNPGLFARLAEIKVRSEARFLECSKDTSMAKDSIALRIAFGALQISVDKLILQLSGDLTMYDGLFGRKTVRKIQALDALIMETKDEVGATISDTPGGRLSVYVQLYNNVQKAYNAFMTLSQAKAPPESRIKAAGVVDIGIMDVVGIVTDAFKGIREANLKKAGDIIDLLGKLTIESPTEKK